MTQMTHCPVTQFPNSMSDMYRYSPWSVTLLCTSVWGCGRRQRAGGACVADLPGRRSLRSARTNRLLVPPVKLSTVGGRAFPVAGPTICNSLPDNVISAPSLSTFRQRLKHFCSRPRSLTLSLISGKLFPTSSGS